MQEVSSRLVSRSFRYVYRSLGCQKDTRLDGCQLPDLFLTTHRVKTQQVEKIRGQYSGDIELGGYIQNTGGTVHLVLDLIVHLVVED